jgi:hypothetical protein
MWKTNFKPTSFFRLDHEKLLWGSLVLLIGLVWVSLDPLLLRVLPINKDGLSSIGRVLQTEGVLQRKVLIDHLPLPLLGGDSLFNGDVIDASKGGRGELSLGQNLSVVVPIGTRAQFKFEDNQLHLHLMKGYLLFNVLEKTTIILESGLQTQSIELDLGLTFVRPTLEGVVAEKATGDQLMQPMLDEIDQFIHKRYKIERIFAVVDGSDPWAKRESFGDPQDVSADKVRLGASKVPSSFPQPENKIVFLMNSPDVIRVAARPVCEDSCELVVKKNRRVIAQETYIRGQSPVLELPVDSSTDASFEWSFSDDAYNEHFEFKVRPFTEENFQRALSQGSNIEIR